MIWVLVCNNMCQYERHFGSFSRHRNPTILETVSIPTAMRILFTEIQWQGIILAPMCLCQGKMWKSKVKNIFSYHFPRWPVRVKPCHCDGPRCTTRYSSFPDCAITYRLSNNEKTATSSIQCWDEVFLQSMAFYVKISTRMVSNNTICDLRNTDLIPPWTQICIVDSCQHASMMYVHISA